MDKDDSKKLEEEFLKRNETLRGLYDVDTTTLSADEIESLTPILNSLRDKVDRYREVNEIAVGGEKKISLVHDHLLDRQVAMARAAHATSPQGHEQFLREARLTANLAHPNIMPVYNMGLDSEGEPFFSMELIPGDSLKTILRKLRDGDSRYKEDFPQDALLQIFIKVCDAIAYAHSRNVLHLDIKPGNIRVGKFGEVLVCDWGLARVMHLPEEESGCKEEQLDADVLNDMTLSGTMKGTPGFMAPEQTLSYSDKTPQTDIYALGALLYMILTYELPVRGDSANEVVQNTREGKVIPPRRRKPDIRISNSLTAVTMKALSRKPEDRYANVLSLKQEVNRYLMGYPTDAERAGFITTLSLLVQRHSRVAFLLMFFLLLLAGVIGANLVAISREKAEAVAARVEAEDNFNLYLKEQRLALALEKDLEEAVLYTVKSRDFVNAPSMIHVLEAGLTEDLDPVRKQNLLEQKGRLHFVLQEFTAANECFQGAGKAKRLDNPRELSAKYARIKPADNRRLADDQLADLFNEIRPWDETTMSYLYYHHVRRRPASATPEQYVPLAVTVLERLNSKKRGKRQTLKLKKMKKGYHLDLSNSKYSTFSIDILGGVYRRNVLAPLKLTSLDISHSEVHALSELRGLRLQELRMVGLDLWNKKSMAKQVSNLKLKRIVLDTENYSEEVLEQLRKNMEVVNAGK
jgi:serine/threonine protein kinase